MHQWAIWGSLLVVVDVLLAGGVTIHAVLWKRDSRAVIAWVGLVWLAPIVGACVYLCLGINRIERKATLLKLRDSGRPGHGPQLSTEQRLQAENFTREHPNLVGLSEAGRALSGIPLVPGNRVEPLIDGDQAYPAMIDAIDSARRSVALLSYIFDSDRAGNAFLDALVQAQKRNVQVRVLIDDVGSKYSRPNMVRRLRAAGLPAKSFLPTRLPRLPRYSTLR